MTSITVGLLVGVAALLIAWDVFVFAKRGKTISEVMRDAGRAYPILAFLLGVLIGHWFFPLGCGQ